MLSMGRDANTLAAIEAVYRQRGSDFFRFALRHASLCAISTCVGNAD
jgi:hypothetical protein